MSNKPAMLLRKAAGSGPAKRAFCHDNDDDSHDEDKVPKKMPKKTSASSRACKPQRPMMWFHDPYGVDPIAIPFGSDDTMYDVKAELKSSGMIQALASVSMSAFQVVQYNCGKKVPLDVSARSAAEDFDNTYATPFQVVVFDNIPPSKENTTPLVAIKVEGNVASSAPHISRSGGRSSSNLPASSTAKTMMSAAMMPLLDALPAPSGKCASAPMDLTLDDSEEEGKRKGSGKLKELRLEDNVEPSDAAQPPERSSGHRPLSIQSAATRKSSAPIMRGASRWSGATSSAVSGIKAEVPQQQRQDPPLQTSSQCPHCGQFLPSFSKKGAKRCVVCQFHELCGYEREGIVVGNDGSLTSSLLFHCCKAKCARTFADWNEKAKSDAVARAAAATGASAKAASRPRSNTISAFRGVPKQQEQQQERGKQDLLQTEQQELPMQQERSTKEWDEEVAVPSPHCGDDYFPSNSERSESDIDTTAPSLPIARPHPADYALDNESDLDALMRVNARVAAVVRDARRPAYMDFPANRHSNSEGSGGEEDSCEGKDAFEK